MDESTRKRADDRGFAARSIASAVSLALCGAAFANPTGPRVAAGQASFANQNKTLTVTNSPGSIINWQGFSIGRDELTRFMQQSSGSSVLNRVVGGNPTEILGRLWSNGRVFLINPSGITFGAGSQIDVAGLVASSLPLSDADFISGRLRFSGSGGEGAVINRGAITTPVAGRVALFGPQVENTGVIRAPSGDIVLAAGATVQLIDTAFPSIHVEVSAPAARPLPLGALSENVFAYAVKQSGILSASAVQVGDGGRIALRSAGNVQLTAASTVAASGRSGGQVDVAAAQNVVVEGGAQIAAGALHTGDGGRVELIAEKLALFAGNIEARGGPEGGEGGKVEVSGRQALVFTGTVDTRAPAGKDGNLLIDPTKITVTSTSTGVPAALGDAFWTSAEDPGSQSLGATNLAGLLNTTSVTLQAAERIEVAPEAIVAIAPAGARTLTLIAPQIVLRGTFRATGAPLNLALNAGSGSVSIAASAQLTLGGGALAVTAQTVSSALPPSAQRETEQGLARSVNIDLAALRAQVEAEIARDNARLARSMKSCDKFADTRQGCVVATPPRRFQFAGA